MSLLLISLSFHSIYKCFIDEWIGFTRIECYAWTQEGLHVVGKLAFARF